MPRPRLLSDGKKHEIVAMLACGCTFEAAARHACCSVKTIRREARRCAEFHERLRTALIESQVTPVNVLHDFARRDWRAAAWLLERTDPGRFAKRKAKTFTEAEVLDLLGRVYDVVRRHIDDKAKRIQIKRQLRTLVSATLHPATKTSLPSAPPNLASSVEPQRAAAAHSNQSIPSTRNSVNRNNRERALAAAQNETKPHPVLTSASDGSPDNFSTSAFSEAT